METKIKIPEGVEVEIINDTIKVRGEKGEVVRTFPKRNLTITKENSEIKIKTKYDNAKMRALLGTFKAHIKNMIKGVQKEFIYKLKICSVHFPMNVSIKGDELQIQNFLGRRKPINVKIPPKVNVNIEGDIITITSPDIELAGMTASRIEKATYLTGKDRRIFQDGIFIIMKAGKEII